MSDSGFSTDGPRDSYDPARLPPDDPVLLSPLVPATALGTTGGPARMLTSDDLRSPRPRRIGLPLALFLITCLSTFWAGATDWTPMDWTQWAPITQPDDDLLRVISSFLMGVRRAIIRGWDQGLIYMLCVLAILLTHEMGHFVATLCYRIPASLPYFIPFPISPIGTMGAVIGMEGFKANRRQMFDIGLAGPLAGLVVAVPILFIGIRQLDLGEQQPDRREQQLDLGEQQPDRGEQQLDLGEQQPDRKEQQLRPAFDCPWLTRIMINFLRPELGHIDHVWIGRLNPYFMAGWVGLLITGLNMMPVSQLDGGHVVYTLFRHRAHWIARGFLMLSITFVVFFDAYMWTPMVVLVTLIGTDHPPTSDDRARLGVLRIVLGGASLLIPILCFPPRGILPV
jgi:Zn-dependent protease